MKVKLLAIIVSLIMLITVFSSCGCEHEWTEATCTTPKTCKLCNETEGEPAEHNWTDATCDTPKTCKDCKETSGEPAGHKWLDATCYNPKVCKNCDATDGEALGHDWLEATTEAPTTCSRCKVTEGTKINTDPRFTTASTKALHGKWTCETAFTGEMFEMDGYIEEIPATLSYEFKNNGDLIADIELHDYFAFTDALKAQTKDALIYTIVMQGYTESQVDDVMVASFGMILDQYVEEYIGAIDLDELFAAFTQDMVYYVGQNGLYVSDSWHGEFESSEYTITDDILVINEDSLEEGGEPFQWKKVK